MTARRKARPGFTLLEVLLASVIAVLLLAALYYSLDIVLKRTEMSRENVATDDLARAVVNRMNGDLSQSLGPLPPKSGGTPVASSGTTTAPATTTTPTTSTTPTTTTTTPTTDPSATATDPAAMTMEMEGTATASDIPYHSGVIGNDKQLTVFMSRLPTSITDTESAADATAVLPADMRRVIYYLSSDGRGLCRQERPWVTADGIRNSSEPDRTDEAGDLIAPEVLDITFEYFDGSSWAGEWDGTLVSSDGVALTGPPRAIRVTLVLEVANSSGGTQKRVQHVFPVRAAIGTYTPPTDGTTTEPDPTATTTPGM